MQRRTIIRLLSMGMFFAGLGIWHPAHARKARGERSKPFAVEKGDSLLAQSGVFGRGPFVIGVLRCADPSSVNKRIQEVRNSTAFRCTLSHRSRNKYKLKYLKALLRDWQMHDDVKIYLRVMFPANAQGSTIAGSSFMSTYAGQITMALAMGNGIAQQDGRIVTQSRFPLAQQMEFEKQILTFNQRARSVEKIKPKDCDLMQFLATITGVVHAALDTGHTNWTNRTKSQTILELKESLKVQDFKMPQKSRNWTLSIA